MFKAFGTVSLRTRIVVPVIAIMLTGIWGLAWRAADAMRKDLEKLVSEQLTSAVGLVATDFDDKLRSKIEELDRIAESITPGMFADPATLRRAMATRAPAGPVSGEVAFVADRNGTVVGTYPERPDREGRSIAMREYFRKVMSSGAAVIGEPLTGRSAPHRAVIPIAVPLRDEYGAIAGVLVGPVGLSDHRLLGLLEGRRIGKSGYYLVASPRSRVFVSASDRSRIMQPVPAVGVNPLLDRRLAEGYDEPGVTVASTGIEMLTVSRNLATTGWVVLAGVPTREVYAPIAAMTRQVYALALLIALICGVTAHLVLTRQLARLKDLEAAMRRMTAGEEPFAELPVTNADEIGRLKLSFNALVKARRNAEEALEKAMQRMRALSERITRVQEERRRRIALELHEELGQELGALKLHLGMMQCRCHGKAGNSRIEDGQVIVDTMLERIRALSYELRPSQLDDFGIIGALRAHCRHQSAMSGQVIHVDAEEPKKRPHPEVELAGFRVAQEALANIARHAAASEAWVRVSWRGGEMHLDIRDDGVGFECDDILDRTGDSGLGLIGMQERVRQVGGRLEIHSRPGAGTRIQAVFPEVAQMELQGEWT